MKNDFQEENLIFIVSQPRSGSTYLQNLLSNNPFTNTSSESWLLLNFANQFAPSLFKAEFDYSLAREASNEYIKKYSEIDLANRQRQFLLDLYKPMAEGYKFVIDKTPRYWEILDHLPILFPKSKIIILKRNPMDVAKSMILTWNLDTLEKLRYFKRDLLLAPIEILKFCNKHRNSKNVYCLRYEDIISDSEEEVEKLYHWIGIPFSNNVLDTQKNSKFKGKFGDPFLNSEKGYEKAKNEVQSNILSRREKEFLSGYSFWLGKKFFLDYGYVVNESNSKKTITFSHYLHVCKERNKSYSIRREFKYLLKEGFFRVLDQLQLK